MHWVVVVVACTQCWHFAQHLLIIIMVMVIWRRMGLHSQLGRITLFKCHYHLVHLIQIAHMGLLKKPINGLERQLFYRFQHVEPNRSPWCQHDRQEVFWPLWPCVPDLFVGVRQPKRRMCSQKCPHVIIHESSIPHHSPNFSSIGPLHLNHSNRTPLHFQWHSIQVISSLQRHRHRLRHRLRRYRLRRLRRVTDVVLAALGPVFFKDPQPPQQQRLGAAPWTKEAAVATAPLQCDEVQRAVDIQFPGIDALKERKSKGAKIWCVLLSFQVFFCAQSVQFACTLWHLKWIQMSWSENGASPIPL